MAEPAVPMRIGFPTKVTNVGGQSKGIYLPQRLADILNLEKGDSIEFFPNSANDGTFVVHRHPPSPPANS